MRRQVRVQKQGVKQNTTPVMSNTAPEEPKEAPLPVEMPKEVVKEVVENVQPVVVGVHPPAAVLIDGYINTIPQAAIPQEPFVVPHRDHLPEKYRQMRFHYKFRDAVTYGAAHSSRGKPLTLRLHSPIQKLTATLPASYSLRSHVAKVLDQGSIGACVAHSGVQAVALVMKKTDSERWMLARALRSGSHFYGSRLFLYDNARRIDGASLSEDSGTTNVSGCMALEKHKLCEESIWPYIEANYSVAPPNEAYVASSRYTTFRYSVVEQNAVSIKKALASGHPVMIGIVVFPSFIQSGLNGGKGDANYPHPKEEASGGHSLLIIGYDDQSERFTFVNHWSTEWGDGGFGTLPYRYLEDSNYSGDFCAVEEFA